MSTRSLRILITNNTLADHAGSELYVRDLALGLLRRGHRPMVFSTVLGEVAETLSRATVPVVDDLAALASAPDLIHGQHHLETMMALLHFPDTPAVHLCHGWQPWEERPPVHPGIRRYIAVDDLCAERLLTTKGIDAARVRTLYNGVDLQRFQPRSPLPERPRTALIFSNYARAGSPSHEAIRAACQACGIDQIDIAGGSSGQVAREPERLLHDYDIVFAKARCALEAMATGCAVVVTDFAGLGGMVTSDNMRTMRGLNFGVRTMQRSAVTEAAISTELARYSREDAARVSDWIRREASFDGVVDAALALYREALDEPARPTDRSASMAASAYLRLLSPRLKSLWQAESRAQSAETSLGELGARIDAALAREQASQQALADARALAVSTQAQLDDTTAQRDMAMVREQEHLRVQAEHDRQIADLQAHVTASEMQLEIARRDNAALRAELEQASHTLHDIHRSRAWRAVSAYRRLRAWLG